MANQHPKADVYKDYIYIITNKQTGNTYIGQTSQVKKSYRVFQHFSPKSTSTAATDVIAGYKAEDIDIKTIPAPFGMTANKINNFLTFFDFAGKRIERKAPVKEKNEDGSITETPPQALLNYGATYSQHQLLGPNIPKSLTIGNILDISEILHIAEKVDSLGASSVKNKSIGGQQSAWFYTGTTTYAFTRQSKPADVYNIILNARTFDLNKLQQLADAESEKWIGKWLSGSAAQKAAEDYFTSNKINNNFWDVSKLTLHIVQSCWNYGLDRKIKNLQNKIVSAASSKRMSLPYGYSLEVVCRDLSTSKTNIQTMLSKAMAAKYMSLKNKTFDLKDFHKVLEEAITFKSTGKLTTIPIYMLIELKPVAIPQLTMPSPQPTMPSNSGGHQVLHFINTDWRPKDTAIQVNENDLKILAYNEFLNIYEKVRNTSFYQGKSEPEQWSNVTPRKWSGVEVFKKYKYNSSNEYLSVRIHDEYRNQGITKYDDVWDKFYRQMINLIPTNLVELPKKTANGWKLYYRDEIVVTSDHARHTVATFLPESEYTPGEHFSLDKIKIY